MSFRDYGKGYKDGYDKGITEGIAEGKRRVREAQRLASVYYERLLSPAERLMARGTVIKQILELLTGEGEPPGRRSRERRP